MSEPKKSQPIGPSSIARIAGNILSGIAAAHANSPSGTLLISERDADKALALARYIARKAEEQSE